jgi:hypothetical protein
VIECFVEDAIDDDTGGVLMIPPTARRAIPIRAKPYLPRIVNGLGVRLTACPAPARNVLNRPKLRFGIDL